MINYQGGYAVLCRESATRKTTRDGNKPFEHVVVLPLAPFVAIFGERLLLAQQLLTLGKELIAEWNEVNNI